MNTLAIVLFLGASFLFMFVAIFVIGSLIGLAKEVGGLMPATSRTREIEEDASVHEPAALPARPSRLLPAETRGEIGAAYSCA